MLRAAREAAGVSLSAMARRTHYSKPYLGLLETGQRLIKPEHVTAYSRALDIPIAARYGALDDPIRLAHEWLVSDSPVRLHHASGRRVGASLADALASRVVELRHLDDVGNPADAALLARSAVTGARQTTPVVRALLMERVAWACAKSRDGASARRALDSVDDVYEQRSVGIEEPEWVYWVNRSEIDVMAGRCMIELGQPRQAEPLLSAAINGYPVEHVRERALYMSWLAESYARVGEIDAARDVIGQARTMSGGANSTRLEARIQHVEALT